MIPVPSPGQMATWTDRQTLTGESITGGAHVNTLTGLSGPLIPDGITSNLPQLQALSSTLQGIAPEPPVPVNITGTVGNPITFSINPTVPSGGTLPNPTIHFLKPNQSFFLIVSAGGSLPSPLSLNTPYYITAANMTPTTFTFSLVNNFSQDIGEGPTVTSSGASATGTVSIVLTGRDVNVLIPPGSYFGGNFGGPGISLNVTPNGITRIRYDARGAIFDPKVNFGMNLNRTMADPKTWSPQVYDLINTTPNELVSNGLPAVVRLQTTANDYYVGQWIAILGLDLQSSLGSFQGTPPNNHFHEFKQITGINLGTGELTLDGPLKWVYLSTFPALFNAAGQIGGGPALIVSMHPAWDTEIEIVGARWIAQGQATAARRVLLEKCVFQGYGDAPGRAVPTVSQSYVYYKCRFGPGDTSELMQVDKMLEYVEYEGCTFPQQLNIAFESTSLQVCLFKSNKGAQVLGTPRRIKFENNILEGLQVGPYLGVTDSCYLNNNVISYFDMIGRQDDNDSFAPGNDMTLVPNWSFSGGIFTRNITGLPGHQAMDWQIMGSKGFFTDASNQFKRYQNMGSPFAILNSYIDLSGNFSFETSLTAVPTLQTSSNVTITLASPGVVTWVSGAHGFAPGTPVCLTTTNTLPTGLTISKVYWVANDGNLTATKFAVSDTKAHALAGTNQINTSVGQSGTHTGYGNPLCFRPHPCTRFTSIANTGCTALLDLNGSIDEPLFSRARRGFVGKQSNLGGGGASANFQQPNSRLWGFLKSMTVNVRKAGTASGTLTVSSPGFTQPNLGTSNFSQVIDSTVAGVRSWTGSAAPTGSGGADSIAAYADWIAGPLVFTWSTAVGAVSLSASPVVEFEIQTDQGITRFGSMLGAPAIPASGSNVWQWNDSGIIQQYGTVP